MSGANRGSWRHRLAKRPYDATPLHDPAGRARHVQSGCQSALELTYFTPCPGFGGFAPPPGFALMAIRR